jgi:hypothetical protein
MRLVSGTGKGLGGRWKNRIQREAASAKVNGRGVRAPRDPCWRRFLGNSFRAE